MMQAIPTVYNKIFAISYLRGEQEQELKRQWQLRMGESDAFFIEAEPGEDYQTTVTALCECIQEQEIVMNAHEPCILAFFVDLQKGIAPELLRQIEAGIKGVLQSSIQAVIQFGYAGKLGLEDPAPQRENACKLVEANREFFAVQHRLCLVASPFLSGTGSNEWKSVCVYLDVLSRQNAPSNLLPGTGSGYAGYLRYGEFDKESYDALAARDEELTTILGSGGSVTFGELLKDKERELRNMVRQRFPIHGTCQPLHPDMFLEPGGIFGRSQRTARAASARESSEMAVEMTGNRLRKDVARAFAPSIANAEAILTELVEAVPLGFALREDGDEMAKLLSAPPDNRWDPPRPSLTLDGYAQEINVYLEKIRDQECDRQAQLFYEALQKASPALVAGDFAEKKAALEKEQKKVKARLKQMYPTKEFCEKFAYAADLPESQFSPVIGSGAAVKFLLCTNSLTQKVANFTNGSGTSAYQIANSEPDNAPLKGVQAVFLECSPNQTLEVMKQLLPEVDL